MSSDQLICSMLHGLGIEAIIESVCETLAQWTARPVPDAVAVIPPRRCAPWIEVARHPTQRPDRDVPGQHGPDGRTKLLGGHPPRPGERDHLSSGMHPGVRPTARGYGDARTTVEVGQCTLQFSLDGAAARLSLETGKLGAVIFDPCAVPHGAALSGALHLVRPATT